MRKLVLFTVAFFMSFAGVAKLQAAEKQKRQEITAGVFINRIDSLDIKSGETVLDIWYWCISKNKNFDLSSLELCNGHLQPQLTEPVKMEKDGLFYYSQRYLATVYCKMDLKRFPFDHQTISLQFEDSNLVEDDMIFKPDIPNSGFDKDFQMNEWEIKNIFYYVKSYRYRTSFGYFDIPSGQGSIYSRYCIELELVRRGSVIQKLFKYFWTIFVSVIVGVVALFIRVKDLGPRFSMAVGSLFANVGCSYTLAEKLPKSPSPTCAEVISYVSLGVIILLLTESIISLAFFNHGREKFSKYLDRGTFFLTLLAYFVLCLWLIRG